MSTFFVGNNESVSASGPLSLLPTKNRVGPITRFKPVT